MADKNQDEFAEINKKVQDQAAEVFNLLYGKYITALSMCIAGEDSGGEHWSLFGIRNGRLFLYPINSNKMCEFEDNCRLLAQGCDVYEYFWAKCVKQSNTWKKMALMNEPVKKNIDFKDVSSAVFDKFEFANESVKETLKSVCDSVNEFVNFLNSTAAQKTVTKTSFTMEKFLSLSKDLKTRALKCASKLKDAWKVLSPESEENKITNLEDAISEAKKVDWISVIDEESKDEPAEEMPKEVQNAVNTVAKEVITVNDKPEDPKTIENFKKVSEDMKKTAEIVKKWADDKNNKAIARRIAQTFKKISPSAVNEVIPQAWVYANMQKFKDTLGEAIVQKQLLSLLNESDENTEDDTKQKEEMANKVKDVVAAVDNILKSDSLNKFKSGYLKWCDMVKNAMEAASKNDKLMEKMKEVTKGNMPNDPYAQILLLSTVLSAKEDDADSSSDKTPPENASSGSSDGSTGGTENASFEWHFQNYIKESLNK